MYGICGCTLAAAAFLTFVTAERCVSSVERLLFHTGLVPARTRHQPDMRDDKCAETRVV